MQSIVISEGQSLPDIVLQYFGDLEQMYPFALEQNLSVSEQPEPGTYYTKLKANVANRNIVEELNKPGNVPATNDELDTQIPTQIY